MGFDTPAFAGLESQVGGPVGLYVCVLFFCMSLTDWCSLMCNGTSYRVVSDFLQMWWSDMNIWSYSKFVWSFISTFDICQSRSTWTWHRCTRPRQFCTVKLKYNSDKNLIYHRAWMVGVEEKVSWPSIRVSVSWKTSGLHFIVSRPALFRWYFLFYWI